MRMLAVGLNHRTAPVEVRERFAIPPAQVPALLAELRDRFSGQEAVLLSTCNRVELYAVGSGVAQAPELAQWLARMGGVRAHQLERHLYQHDQRAALRHLFRVTSSLDSMVLGEPQIVAQVKEAWRVAAGQNAVGPTLHRVGELALSVAKRVRTETTIAREGVSVGRSGVELSRQVLGPLVGRSALLIGAGATGKVVARAMLDRGLDELVVANRTFERASALADRFGASAAHLDEIPRLLARVDIAVASTGAGRFLIDKELLAPVVRRRRYKPLVLIDLSVPRNISPAVNELEGVYRFDLDDLQQLADQGLVARQAAAGEAELIVGEEVERCWRLLLGQGVNQRLGHAVRRAEELRRAELQRAQRSLTGLTEAQQAAVEGLTRGLVNKLLHPSLQEARRAAEQGEHAALEAAMRALGLKEES